MRTFIDQHRQAYGVESICKILQVAPSGYWRYAAQRRNPALRCARAKSDEVLAPQIERIWQANMQVYGAEKVWRQLRREGIEAARCTVERLMRHAGLRGVMRGKVVKTTIGNAAAPCPLDRVNRQFTAQRPNQLWVSDFTYVSTWQGFVYVAFVIDVFARRIVGWRVSSSMRTEFVLDALEQALYARQPERDDVLIHHSDRGSQYVSIRYSERLAEAVNLEHTGASMTNREGLDPLNTKPLLDLLARTFLAGALPNHPLASPVFADVTGLPPILVQIGENELMLSDAIRLASHLAENRVRVNLEVWPQMPHAWHFFQSFLPEAEQALRESARFISETVGSAK